MDGEWSTAGQRRRGEAPAAASSSRAPDARPPCRFYQIGQCTAGKNCRFSHEQDLRSAPQVKLATVCKFWKQGHCAHGERCPFSHGPLPAPAPKPLRGIVVPAVPKPSVPTPPPPMLHGPLRAPPPTCASSARVFDPSSAVMATVDEVRHSAALQCGICLEPVVTERGRFGLLEGCDHCFCLECLREWRNTHAIRPEVARSCPECRAPSHFVTPSAVHLTADRKRLLILAYQKARC